MIKLIFTAGKDVNSFYFLPYTLHIALATLSLLPGVVMILEGKRMSTV